jgi:hypothetical protein
MIIPFALLITAGALNATTYDTLPVTGADVAQVLELNPADYQITKTSIDFGAPKYVTLRFTPGSNARDFPISGMSSSITLLTYVPKDEGQFKPLRFWVSGSGGGIHSSFPFDSSKVKFTQSTILDGIFTIRASETEDFSKPTYKIEILTSDKKAKDATAAPGSH